MSPCLATAIHSGSCSDIVNHLQLHLYICFAFSVSHMYIYKRCSCSAPMSSYSQRLYTAQCSHDHHERSRRCRRLENGRHREACLYRRHQLLVHQSWLVCSMHTQLFNSNMPVGRPASSPPSRPAHTRALAMHEGCALTCFSTDTSHT